MKRFKKIGVVIPQQIGMDSAYRIYDASRNNLMTRSEEEREELARELKIRWNLHDELVREVKRFRQLEGHLLAKVRKLRRKS